MQKVGLVVTLEAKAGREEELAQLLRSGLPLVQAEPETERWFAYRSGPKSFGIFDTFPTPKARAAHLAGRLASALMARAPDLLATPPSIVEVDVLEEK